MWDGLGDLPGFEVDPPVGSGREEEGRIDFRGPPGLLARRRVVSVPGRGEDGVEPVVLGPADLLQPV